MKKRRIAIASFLMLAVLVMGIGFASVTGDLLINGTAAYAPAGLVDSATVQFANPVTNGSTVALSNNNATATVDVSFADNNGVADYAGFTYSATAQLDVVYTGDANLSDLRVSIVNTTAFDEPGFSLTTEWVGNDNIVGPGETIQVLLTIQYTVQDPVPTSSVADSFAVTLHYQPVA